MERKVYFIQYGRWEPSGAVYADLSLNEKLRQLRRESGWSLKTVVAKAGISKGYLWQLETETCKMPSAAILYRLSKVYNVQMECFFKHSIMCVECGQDIEEGAWSWTVEYTDGDIYHFHSECLGDVQSELMDWLAERK